MEQEQRLFEIKDDPAAATVATKGAETAETSIAMPEFSTTEVLTTRNTDEGCSGSTDSDSDSNSDGDDDDDFADDPEAVVYEHNSATGAELLGRIRTALAMHPTTPFAEVRRFLEHNGSVIRHLVTMTVPHPDHYVTEPTTGTLHEPAVRGAKKTTASGGGGGGGGCETLVAVAMLDWHSPLIDRHLANMVFYERERKTIRFREVMRKYRRGTHSRGAYRWLRAHNATSCIWDDEQRRMYERRRRRRLRVQHRGSWLVNEVRADWDEAMED
ncbi:hypothetical protein BBAD15_g2448 [Beauveria bassiana D1-5]|uniref:Uncharacterized protein n=1 Tax=Beauveria bassiana D1-5 TaxID=1245745 RepID=A0A0A2VZL8_BEABA|nr:hypothetical protein BBAD15_g2448 [Beauveria bassiana D1-5]